MTARVAATVGKGRILARIGRDGSLISLRSPHLDHEPIELESLWSAVTRTGAPRPTS